MKHEPTNRLTIMVTDDCNLNCKNCVTYAQDGKLGKNVINTNFVSQTLQKYREGFKDRESGLLYLFFSGRGEPTLRMDVIEEIYNNAVRYLDKENLYIGIQTNGVFKKDTLEKISQISDTIWISVDGAPQDNDAIRKYGTQLIQKGYKGGSSEYVTKNTRALLREGKNVRWRSTIHNNNMSEKSQKSLVDYAENLGIKTIIVEPSITSPSLKQYNPSRSIYLLDINEFIREFIQVNQYAAIKGIQYTTGLMEDARHLYNPHIKRCNECFCINSQASLPRSATLTVDGRIVGCYLGYEDTNRMDSLTFGKWDGHEIKINKQRLEELAGMQSGCVGRSLLGNDDIQLQLLEKLYSHSVYPDPMPRHS